MSMGLPISRLPKMPLERNKDFCDWQTVQRQIPQARAARPKSYLDAPCSGARGRWVKSANPMADSRKKPMSTDPAQRAPSFSPAAERIRPYRKRRPVGNAVCPYLVTRNRDRWEAAEAAFVGRSCGSCTPDHPGEGISHQTKNVL